MKLLRPRCTIRQMLIAVAVAAVMMIPLAEELRRRHLVDYYAQQELLSERRAWELFQKGRAALVAGRSREATESFAAYNYWNEQARGHLQMQKVYRNPWWVFAR